MRFSAPRLRRVRGALVPALALCLFALIAGAKWAVFDRYGSPMPDWDQWDAEGANLLLPWIEGRDFLAHLFAPHNEHRVVLTKLQALALYLISGQWDARLQAVTNALLHSTIIATLWFGVRRWIGAAWHGALFGLAFVLFGLPVAWQNVLGGFHSQQYWLVGLSAAAVALLPFARPWTAPWWWGAIAATLALGSMGSGFLAAFVVLLVAGWRLARRETTWHDALPALVLCGVVVAVGVATRVEPAFHAHMRVKTALDFVFSLLHSLQWPLRDADWAGPLLWLPWLVAAGRVATGRANRAGQILVALGGWVVGQIIATAYARGAGADYPASRYMDTLAFGTFVNGLALAWLLSHRKLTPSWRRAGLVFAAGWLLVLSAGLRKHLTDVIDIELPDARNKYYDHAEANLAGFLATGDRRHLGGPKVPYPNPEQLAAWLSHPGLRAAMPVPLRPPLPLEPAEIASTFAVNDARSADPEQPPRRGLSPTTPPLAAAVSWGSHGSAPAIGAWRSQPLAPPRLGWLKFETAGDLGRPGAAVGLALRDARTGALLDEIRPSRVPGDSWRAAYVRAPRVPFVVEARDDSAAHWLAFSGPVEMSAPSHWARQATKQGMLLSWMAAGLAALLALSAWLARPSRRRSLRDLSDHYGATETHPRHMRFFTLPALLATLVLSVVAALPFLPVAKGHGSIFRLEGLLTSTVPGSLQVFFDDGRGFGEDRSARAHFEATTAPVPLRVAVPAGTCRLLRLDPLDRGGTVTLRDLRIVAATGRVVARLPGENFTVVQQVASLRTVGDALEISVAATDNDPQLHLAFASPLEITARWADHARGSLGTIGGIFAGLGLLLFALDRAPRWRSRVARWSTALAPARAIGVVAALAVAASAYPVVFLGKSYVSPNLGTILLYDTYPTLPDYTASELADVKLSDVGAVMWQHVPFSMMQRRALASGELPLWNRYNAAGVPLLAQGQSMFGDPLHLFVVAANGAAWSWDLKYLAAKWLFAAGLGLIVLRLTRHTGAAVIVALTAPFVGFFLYRVNHPAFFSLCYAPWPLYCLVRLGQAATRHAIAASLAGLVVANLALMNSGTVKEAYMLLVCMNFSGACFLLASPLPWRDRLARLAALAGTGAAFACCTAPIWATFLQTLKGSYTGYNAVSAFQIQPTLLLGAFDEIFYRPLMEANRVFSPSLNFLLLLGVLYFLATLREQFTHRALIALAASSLVPLALAFGLVPPQWIVTLPFLGNVAHLDNTFSCALIVLWSVLAGVGFAAAARRLGTREGRGDLAIGGLLLFALVFGWIAFRQASHRPIFGPIFSVHPPGKVLAIEPFVWGHLIALLVGAVVVAWVARRALVRHTLGAGGVLLLVAGGAVLVWRQALHAPAVGFEEFTVRPTVRTNFHARSGAIDYVRAEHAREPGRGFGFNGNFFPGWTGVYGLETVHGPDALVNPWLRELIGVSGVERIWDWRLYAEAANVAAVRPFLDALNVRFYFDLLSKHPALAQSLTLAHGADLDVWRSDTAWPRAFFTDRLDAYDQPADLVAKLRAAEGRPFAAVQRSDPDVTAARAALPRDAAARTVAPATAYRLTENATRFTVRASGPGVIVLTEAFWPGDFRAEVNGRKTQILRVNHAFKGVRVDAAGDYTVEFRYVPKNWPRNLALAAAGAAGFAVLLWFALHRARRA